MTNPFATKTDTKKEDSAITEDPFQTDTIRQEYSPIERDPTEARELLRLSQLEGRDPLQDAVAGRLALDRLDAVADGDGDLPEKQWADALRRELRERFNEIAPTKFEIGGRDTGDGDQGGKL